MIIQRNKASKDRITGVATLPDGTEIRTIELPWRDNKVGVSCIPAGHYFFMRDTHGRHKWWKILDVKDRTFIEWHEGYNPKHSKGCILSSKQDLIKMDEFYNQLGVRYNLEIRDNENT